MISSREQKQLSNINIVTTDAHTLTDGPTIFLADDVEKIAKFYVQSAQIPDAIINKLMSIIKFNTTLNEQISELQKELEDGSKKNEQKEKKSTDARVDPDMKKIIMKIDEIESQIKTVMLNPIFVPNTKDHLYKHAYNVKLSENNKPFTSNISTSIIVYPLLLL